MKVNPSLLLATLSALAVTAQAQTANETLYDESKIPAYQLPDPLKLQNGSPVRSTSEWENQRRPELLRLFSEHVFGKTPTAQLPKPTISTISSGQAFGGKATRRQLTVMLAPGHPMRILMYLPSQKPPTQAGPVPVFLALNFHGNQSINADSGIEMTPSWVPEQAANSMSSHRAAEASRGLEASRWPVETILARGYGLVTVYAGDLDPDYYDYTFKKDNVQKLFLKNGEARPDSTGWGTLGAWAWGLSRAMDYLATDPAVDAKRVALLGHSRMGKAALWAAAQDPRFALVISNESGEGGAAIARRRIGERIVHLTHRFPHWYARSFGAYDEREEALPVDFHELLALIAPRPLYVASAVDDQWSDPKGEFLSAKAASPVYALYGEKGLADAEFPTANQPVGTGKLRYHVRTGKHDVTDYDWARYLDFADGFLKK